MPLPLWLLPVLGAAAPYLVTTAETSKFTRTGRYDEVIRLCRDFERAFPARVSCTIFGTTPEGRSMMALVASEGARDPAAAKEKRRPVILIQGGIHAGEIDGKDAGFLLLREILHGKAAPGALSAVTLVFVPVFNVDGHERFGPNNRPNQRGPVEMGWRTTAQNLNLNRDYTKAEAPEMAAMLRLLLSWDPVAVMDLHVTDGADFQHDVAVMVEPAEAGGFEPLRAAGKKLRSNIAKNLSARGHLPIEFYPSFEKEDDPSSGFSTGVPPPRFSQGYWSTHNRLGILIETHSWKDYPTRVRATHDAALALIELAARDGAEWKRIAADADDDARKLGGLELPLLFDATARTKTIEFLGWRYVREPSAISGRVAIRYDDKKPEVWKVPFHDELEAKLVARAPKLGYLVPAACAPWVRQKLEPHGIRVEELSGGRQEGKVELFRASDVSFRKESYEGRMTAAVKGEWSTTKRSLLPGSLLVPIAQPRSRLVVHLLEPTGPDSLVAWGYFNAYFEQKEYMEPYVAERVGREMLAKDPALAAEFARKLETDPDFAASPEKRLDFFYRRHPSWDQQMNVYPVLRADE